MTKLTLIEGTIGCKKKTGNEKFCNVNLVLTICQLIVYNIYQIIGACTSVPIGSSYRHLCDSKNSGYTTFLRNKYINFNS
jgi:hypothetical protein